MTHMDIVLESSPAAAKQVSGISGWVDRHGRYFGKNEQAARRSGSTHNTCPGCGQAKPKSYMFCEDCRARRAEDYYNNMPATEWDGETPLYSSVSDTYFFDMDQLLELSAEYCTPIHELQLVVCEPVKFREIDEDQFYDFIPEESDLPPELLTAIEVLNSVIRGLPTASWAPGKLAAIIGGCHQ